MADSADPAALDVSGIQQRLREFAAEREWQRFHTPKNLAMALASEMGELVELFQWLSEAESRRLSDRERLRVGEEIADIQIYLLRLTDVLGVDLADVVERKLLDNAERYPVDLSRGNATKYSRRDGE